MVNYEIDGIEMDLKDIRTSTLLVIEYCLLITTFFNYIHYQQIKKPHSFNYVVLF